MVSTRLLSLFGLGQSTIKERVTSNMHLYAVLPRLGDMARLDENARALARKIKGVLEFRVANGPQVFLRFADGEITTSRTPLKGPTITLWFHSCGQLNALFAGEDVKPLPLKGLLRIGQLGAFTQLTELLTRYLKPSDEDLADPAFRLKHVELSLLVGLAAAGEVVLDPAVGRVVAAMHDGSIQYRVHGGPSAYVVMAGGATRVSPGTLPEPTSTIELRDVDFTVGLIKGEVDTFAAMGKTDIRITGSIPLADEFNTLFDRVGQYID